MSSGSSSTSSGWRFFRIQQSKCDENVILLHLLFDKILPVWRKNQHLRLSYERLAIVSTVISAVVSK